MRTNRWAGAWAAIAGLGFWISAGPLVAVGSEPQPLRISPAAENTFLLDWPGAEGRTYFLQFALDLKTWVYAPFIHFGEEAHQRGVATDTPRMFFRLVYADMPGVESLDDAMAADFSGDGLSNLFKVTHGYSPFEAQTTGGVDDAALDPDGDGLSNLSEFQLGRDPMRMDHPAVALEVVIE